MAKKERGDFFWSDIIFNLLSIYLFIFVMVFIWCIQSAAPKKMKKENAELSKTGQ